jgi:NAD(P)-dependent dehydrogenase (short-subunit alcohol dehydrogenase family)
MPTVLITGAGRGLGLEFASQYAKAGWRVIATCRDPFRSEGLKTVKAEVHVLDVTDYRGVLKLAKELESVPIDLLLNNAAIFGDSQEFGSIDPADWLQVLNTDVVAPMMMAQAFLANVAKSRGSVMAFMSSRMGSISENGSGGFYVYRTAKAALNMIVKGLSVDLEPQGIVTVALHPGWVKTEMGGPEAPLDVTTSVTGLRKVLGSLTDKHNGKFLGYDGLEIPW